MQKIIEAVDKSKLESELTKDKFVRYTKKSNNKIYIFTYHDSPNLMREIGRLRELTFRGAGGGTGKEIDIDEYDVTYKQLIVWNPEYKEIVGGYRFLNCKDIIAKNSKDIHIATKELFEFSENFIQEYLPYTVELGRSFIQPAYQLSIENLISKKKTIFVLDNIWDGLGSIITNNHNIKYFFGKVTMYPNYNLHAKDMLLYFLHKYFPDNENLVYPYKPLGFKTDVKKLESIFNGNNYQENYKILLQNIKKLKERIPPLINSYMNLSSTMKTFGTAINYGFGNVEETGILIYIKDIFNEKIDRHLDIPK
jgi:hypothetical protein